MRAHHHEPLLASDKPAVGIKSWSDSDDVLSIGIQQLSPPSVPAVCLALLSLGPPKLTCMDWNKHGAAAAPRESSLSV